MIELFCGAAKDFETFAALTIVNFSRRSEPRGANCECCSSVVALTTQRVVFEVALLAESTRYRVAAARSLGGAAGAKP